MTKQCSLNGDRLKSIIPSAVKELCQELNDNGKQCYIVGGATRDILIGAEPKDYDLTTDATPDEMIKIFKEYRVVPSGIEHGTVMIIKDGMGYEITTYRTEGKYSDGRRPDWVKFTDNIQEDLERRDLTINAIAYNPLTDEIVTTPNDGIDDIKRCIIKAVGVPSQRFKEDGLRTMRVCRFASRLGFDIDRDTKDAIIENIDVIDNISQERIREEIVGILEQSEKPSVGIDCLRETGLLKKVLPEVDTLYGVEQPAIYHKYDVYTHTMEGLDTIPKGHFISRLAFLLHDIGKPSQRKWNEEKQRHMFVDHEDVGAAMAKETLTRLKFPRDTINKVTNLIENHLINYDSDWTNKAVRKFVNRVGEDNLNDLFILHQADILSRKNVEVNIEKMEEFIQRIESLSQEMGKTEFTTKDLAISGHDVMEQLDIPPSPEVGNVLNYLLDKVLEDPTLNNHEDLLKLMKDVTCK